MMKLPAAPHEHNRMLGHTIKGLILDDQAGIGEIGGNGSNLGVLRSQCLNLNQFFVAAACDWRPGMLKSVATTINSARILLSVSAALASVLVLCASLAAQGTQSDYQRANSLRARTDGTVFKSRVTPHWLADNSRFWYRNDLVRGMSEYVLVDAIHGTRQPAFDHARLAAAIATATGKRIEAKRLAIDQIGFDAKEPVMLVRSEGKTWRCDLRSYELRQQKDEEKRVCSIITGDCY
jgi:hypothetical protein